MPNLSEREIMKISVISRPDSVTFGELPVGAKFSILAPTNSQPVFMKIEAVHIKGRGLRYDAVDLNDGGLFSSGGPETLVYPLVVLELKVALGQRN